jgi:hypothetical protein
LAVQHRQLMPEHRDLHRIGVRRRTAAEHTQNPHQRACRTTSPQTSAVALTWHPTPWRLCDLVVLLGSVVDSAQYAWMTVGFDADARWAALISCDGSIQQCHWDV